MKLESCLYWLISVCLRCLDRLPSYQRKTAAEGAPRALLTGAFQTESWVRAHIQPMLDSSRFERLAIVTTSHVPIPEGVHVIRPPEWLLKFAGEGPSRLLTFTAVAIRQRPEVIGGFHLLFNGLVAIVLARLLGARSLYFCVNGEAEVLAGDASGPRMKSALVRAVSHADVVICMGSRSAEYMKEQAEPRLVVVNPGGVHQPPPEPVTKAHDMVFLGRLAPYKNLEAQIEAVALLNGEGMETTLLIVGDIEDQRALQRLAEARGVQHLVTFAGVQEASTRWLRSARVFVLSSPTESLSLGLMEALAAGLPAVVPNAGDLADLVKDGYNGVVLQEASPQAIADAVTWLLAEDRYPTTARNAAQSAIYVSPARAAARWANTMQHLGWHRCAA